MSTLQQWFNTTVAPYAQADPSVLDVINLKRAARITGIKLNVPPEAMNSPEESQALIDQREQAVQAQQQVETLSQAASAAKDGSVAASNLGLV